MSELLQAVYRGDRARVVELLAGKPELDVFEAAAVGRVDRLRALLDEDPGLANAWAEDGFQPLGLASFFGHAEAARLLVERGADVNSASRNDFEVTPLHSAVAEKDADTRYEIAKLRRSRRAVAAHVPITPTTCTPFDSIPSDSHLRRPLAGVGSEVNGSNRKHQRLRVGCFLRVVFANFVSSC